MERPMTTCSCALGVRRNPATVLVVSLLSGLFIGGLALPARANNASVGSTSMGSSRGGHMVGVPGGMRQTRSIFSLNRTHLHHDRRRDRGLFADGFFPFGFGWPISEPDLVTPADEGDTVDQPGPPVRFRLDRYEPPTVEKTPSGVTIIRGPGSHHGLSPY